MRRMNYNPFEKPFASGTCSSRQFLLDKPLELGSIYFILVYSSEGEVSTAILSTFENKNGSQFFSTGYVDYDADGSRNIFFLEWAIASPSTIDIKHDTLTAYIGARTIYIYKII